MEDFANKTQFLENFVAGNVVRATLNQGIDAAVGQIPVSSLAPWADQTMGWITIDNEVIFWNAKDAGNLTLGTVANPCTRGVDGTTAATHTAGAWIQQKNNAALFNNLVEAIPRTKWIWLQSNIAGASELLNETLAFVKKGIVHELVCVPDVNYWSSDINVDVYNRDRFGEFDKLFSFPASMWSNFVLLNAQAAAGQKLITPDMLGMFTPGDLLILGNPWNGTWEYAEYVQDVAPNMELKDLLLNTWDVGTPVVQVYRSFQEIYFENGGGLSEIYFSLNNADGLESAQVRIGVNITILEL